MFDQVPDGEIRRIALPSVAEFLPIVQRSGIGAGQDFDFVTERLQCRLEQDVLRNGQSADQNSRLLALAPSKGLRIPVVPLRGGTWIEAETFSF